MQKKYLMNQIETENTEIEIKISINDNDFAHLQEWLSVNAEYIGKSKQKDYYFDNPSNSWFIAHNDGYRYALKYLRVRSSDDGNSICFKNWTSNNASNASELYCYDVEIPIADSKPYILFFEALGFTDKTIIKKIRQSYVYGDFAISIDTTQDLGTFVEFEIKKRRHKNPEDEYKKIQEFIKAVGLKRFTIQKHGFVILAWNRDFPFLNNTNK